MKNFFSMDAPLFRILSTLYDLIILNLLTLAACLPIVTAGASLTAMHAVLIGMARDEEPYIVRSFLRALRENLRQSTLVWCGYLLVSALCFRCFQDGGVFPLGGLTRGCAGIVLILLFLLSLYLFPLLARFRNTTARTIQNSAALMVAYLFRTAGMAAVHVLCAGLFLAFLPWTVSLFVLFGLSLPGYLCALLYSPVLLRLEKRSDGEEQQEEKPEE